MDPLSDPSYRKTPQCSYYTHFLSTKNLPKLTKPITNKEQFISSIKTNFNQPILIDKDINIGLTISKDINTLQDISNIIIGQNYPINLIEVSTQNEIKGWTFQDYVNYINNRNVNKHKILNLISLEFSKTPLAMKVQSPEVVRIMMDWVDLIWPIERRARGDYPQSKYAYFPINVEIR